MKFIHTADIHWNMSPDVDSPWAESRKKAIQDTFRSLISLVKKEQIPLLLISGDLFHNQPLLRDLKEVNQLFASISQTRVVLIAGNQDYIRASSPYHGFVWADNVTFLSDQKLTSVYFPELDTEVYGFSYHSPEITEPLLDHIQIPEHRKCFRILLAHGGDEQHLPISMETFLSLDFDYIAMGHLHRPSVIVKNKVAYAGSLEPLGKNEPGKHGYVFGEYLGKTLTFRHMPLARLQYISLVIHITRKTSNEELLELVSSEIKKRGIQNIYRFRLRGFSNPEESFDLSSLQEEFKIIDILDESEPEYDYESLEKKHENDLIGLYIQSLRKTQMNKTEKKALAYGLKALMQNTQEG
ncbi:hypothetical protein FACS189418_9180 [Clostridia bacterium]|nr:hypothetical protein FACS189418_9180 [Clostridia bacterium]